MLSEMASQTDTSISPLLTSTLHAFGSGSCSTKLLPWLSGVLELLRHADIYDRSGI